MRRARVTYKGAFHHAMNRGYNGTPIFKEDEDKETFLRLLREISEKLRIRILCYCIMDNHYHIILQNSSGKMSKFFKQLNGQYGTIYRTKYGGRGYVFQDRFKSMIIQKDSYLLLSIAYVLKNPVRARVVKNSINYKWSSINEYFNEIKSPVTDRVFTEELFDTRAGLLSMIRDLNIDKLPTAKTEVGTIMGGGEFIVKSKELFNRRSGSRSLEGRRIDDKYFEPVEKVFFEFERKYNIKVDKLLTHTNKGKKKRAELLCNLKDFAGLSYREIGKFNIFSDLKVNSLPSIYKNYKKSVNKK